MTPTARTLAHLRRLGYLAAVVETYLPAVRRRRDLYGIGDVLAVHPGERSVLLVQCTSDAHVSDRLRRVRARPELPLLLAGGVAVEVWGWRSVSRRWYVRRVRVEADMVATVEAPPRRRRRARRGERQRLLFPPDGGPEH
jgi:hypothetical protein